MLFIDLEVTLNCVLFLTSDTAGNLFSSVPKIRACPWHCIKKKFHHLLKKSWWMWVHTRLAGFSRGLLCSGPDSVIFVCCLSRQKQKVMIVIITTRLLPDILPATSLLTLGGLNTWEKSIKRKSNSCPQCEPGLGKKSVSPA